MLSQQPILRQEQRLKMTPQLYQSIRIMAMPLQDLKVTIQEEIELNPALEIIEDNSTTSLDSDPASPEDDNIFSESSDPGYLNRMQSSNELKPNSIENTLSRPVTLQDHLLWQLRLQPLTEKEFALGELLIRNLDNNGFILEEPETLDQGSLPEQIEKLIRIIQSFDPIGCCTRNFIDALLAQIRVHPNPKPYSAELVRNYMNLAQRGKILEIANKMAIPKGKVDAILTFVRALDPIPGRNYSAEQIHYVSPDVIVKKVSGELHLMMNDEQIPTLIINTFYEQLSNSETDLELKKFVNRNLQEARLFIQSINGRNRSLLRVANALILLQQDFFVKGSKYLSPLTLKDVASEIGLHETTVSRIVNGKYIQTEYGIHELRYFFTNSISGSGSKGSRFSKTGVKEMLREILLDSSTETGEKKKILSDNQITKILTEKGVNIARRTVAKYRKELDIESSYRRV